MLRQLMILAIAAEIALVLVAAQPSLAIPRSWDDSAVADLEVPLADPKFSAQHVTGALPRILRHQWCQARR
jgi:hypothetical protein